MTILRRFSAIALGLAAALGAAAQLNIPSDGSDGVFAPTANVEIDLSRAVPGVWSQPGNGDGVYDPNQWAVVFKYASVNIPAGVTVRFKNHPKNPPVVWLVQGNVTIAGTIDLRGQVKRDGSIAQGGPGGFRGAQWSGGFPFGWGYGPGGARGTIAAGAYAQSNSNPVNGRVYGNAQIVPLIGGSSGAISEGWASSIGAPGAILIGAGNSVLMNGTINANSYGYSSGGAVRLIGDSVSGSGNIFASGDPFAGRVRIESSSRSLEGNIVPPPSLKTITGPDDFQLWPDASHPRVEIVRVDAAEAPEGFDPEASLAIGRHDFSLSRIGRARVRLETLNVPANWSVELKAVKRTTGTGEVVLAAEVQRNGPAAIWEAEIDFPAGSTVLQARAFAPAGAGRPAPAADGGRSGGPIGGLPPFLRASATAAAFLGGRR